MGGDCPVLLEGEKIELEQDNCKLYFDQENKGEGKMVLTNERVMWLSTADAALGYAIDYPTFIMHAISRSKETFDFACIYCQLQSDAEDDEEAEIPELRFVPKDDAQLEAIFKTFSEMSALHPDPCQSGDEDDDDNLFDPNHEWITADNINQYRELCASDNEAAMEDAEEDAE